MVFMCNVAEEKKYNSESFYKSIKSTQKKISKLVNNETNKEVDRLMKNPSWKGIDVDGKHGPLPIEKSWGSMEMEAFGSGEPLEVPDAAATNRYHAEVKTIRRTQKYFSEIKNIL